MEIRFATAKIKRPSSLNKYGDKYPPHIKIQIVEAKKQKETVPDDENPIIWRLLTTCEVSNWLDAVTIVYWYTLRWLIEELFGLHKSKGFNIEKVELTTGYALRKLGIILIHIQNLHYLKVYFSLLVLIFINRNSGCAFKKCLD